MGCRQNENAPEYHGPAEQSADLETMWPCYKIFELRTTQGILMFEHHNYQVRHGHTNRDAFGLVFTRKPEP